MTYFQRLRIFRKAAAGCLLLLSLRLLFLFGNRTYAKHAAAQTVRQVRLFSDRGPIRDRSGNLLTDRVWEYCYFLDPGQADRDELLRSGIPFSRQELEESERTGKPVIVRSPVAFPACRGVSVYRHARRYEDSQPASQLIGYLNEDGHGVSGLEARFDELLFHGGPAASVTYAVNAAGGIRMGSTPLFKETGAETGLTLTLDRALQEKAEQCLRGHDITGCILVADTETGGLLAMASSPAFSPAHPEMSVARPDSPFLNRTLGAYDAGSIFKIITTAAALEAGRTSQSPGWCGGYYDTGCRRIACANPYGHGKETLEEAFKESCNPYFCALAVSLGGTRMLETAKRFGLGRYTELCPGFCGASGSLPSARSLNDRTALALFGFGQGNLQVTPLQMLNVVSIVANGGVSVPLHIIRSVQKPDGTSARPDLPAGVRVIEPKTARVLTDLMAAAVKDGSGFMAESDHFDVCGKTGTAETGWISGGGPMVHGWFVGFFPAEHPRYSAVVFCENGKSGAMTAAPLFREIAEWIWAREGK